ncbi:hypothetical protein P389DRAFT_212899 [Cystobasidium minutum MCA 4210]|uniref:uncharacterized protein n=1 Tax=Cystobasidium minutum MCA 4210 TaxID=1397322 RepID=UPI0034CF72E2|eukprot:jgi/Rhomi1/212899/estExt_Genemark1.C_80112
MGQSTSSTLLSSYGAPEPLLTLAGSLCISYCAYVATSALIPRLRNDFIAKGLKGIDLLKGYERDDGGKLKGPALPESSGMIGAAVYVLLLTFFAPLPYYSHFLPPTSLSSKDLKEGITADAGVAFPHHSLTTYLASLLSLLIATFLGFLDDVFDIRWRYKLPIPIIASVPLLVVYFAGHGVTDIVLPRILGLRKLLNVEHVSGVLHLGPLYYLYMSMLSTFCTNSINILAGINGLEVGQSLVIALSIALNDLLYIRFNINVLYPFSASGKPHLIGFGLARDSPELADRHLFSLYFMLPLIGVCFGLLKHNWYPAKAFIGDTFCYFAGMAFAVVGILGHFSKTLLLFFIPQVVNFIFSCPQLFGLVPCPRHRVPRFDPKTGLLYPSIAVFEKPPSLLTTFILRTFAMLRLVELTYDTSSSSNGKKNKKHIKSTTNLTLICMVLCLFGPMREPNLTKTLMAIQAAGSVLAFVIRYAGAGLFYESTRR